MRLICRPGRARVEHRAAEEQLERDLAVAQPARYFVARTSKS
jgi:hypothetical protein